MNYLSKIPTHFREILNFQIRLSFMIKIDDNCTFVYTVRYIMCVSVKFLESMYLYLINIRN